MQNQPSRRSTNTAATSKPSQSAAPSSASARIARHARTDGGRIGAESLGAPPSNTAPNTCNGEYFKALRWGVDSLYLTYPGELLPVVLSRLKALKEMAQDKDPQHQALAQYPLGGHVFEVKDKGARLFPFILEDGAFRIQLGKGGKVPMALVKVSALFLAHVGSAEAERRLYGLLIELGDLAGAAQVSRIDLFCDFVWTGSCDWPRKSWVTRAAAVDNYSEDGTFTGWVIGRGGVMLGRLYDKLLQANKIGADYLLPLWRAAGWKDDEPVWRMEFQIKREVLTQMQLVPLVTALDNLNGLWSYATDEWLRLAIPQDTDKTRSRWPIHPLWGYLSSIDWGTPGGPLTREFDPMRAPADSKLYSMYLAALVGFMAKRGLQDLYQAQEAMIADVVSYFMGKAYQEGIPFDQYIAERVALKVRQYGSGLNAPDGLDALDQAKAASAAAAYRKASRG